MESLLLIENTVKKNKLDLKDTYFRSPLSEDARKYARFYWKGNLYKFFCPCFGLVPGPYIFTKSLKVPVVFLRRLSSLIIIYQDDMLIIGKSVEETLVYRDKVILLMQELGFCDKSGEIGNDSNTNNSVLGYKIRFQGNDYLTYRKENSKRYIEMSGFLPEPSCIQFGIDKSPGSHNLHNWSSIICKFKFPLPSTAVDSSPNEKGWYIGNIVLKESQSRISYGGFRIWRSVTLSPLNQPPQVCYKPVPQDSKWNHDYWWISFQCPEQTSRPRISLQVGQFRIDA